MTTTAQRPGEAEFLATYDLSDFERPSVTVDLAIFTIRDGVFSVLLVRRAEHPYKGFWALPGGFLRGTESIEAAAWRELGEETSVQPSDFDGHLEQLRSYGDPERDPRGRILSIAHVAFAPNLPDPQAGSDAAEARWWPVAALGVDKPTPDAPTLAFDHAQILANAVERVRAKIEYTTLSTMFVAEPFTYDDLRQVFAEVWGRAPARGNFIRKVNSTEGFVVKTGVISDSAASPRGGRPPMLLRRGTATTLHPPLLRPTRDDETED